MMLPTMTTAMQGYDIISPDQIRDIFYTCSYKIIFSSHQTP